MNYDYIIMCGGNYNDWQIPRQLIKVGQETIVERTIRLLRENGVQNISITSHDKRFTSFDVPVIFHKNNYTVEGYDQFNGYWVDAFCPTNTPTCYIFGDVFFSPEAIRTIVQTETDDVMFFASSPPFDKRYVKKYAEPFAFKVNDIKHFFSSIEKVKEYQDKGNVFKRKPIAWELWQVVKGTKLNHINYRNYVVINDYTCDVDYPSQAEILMRIENAATG